MAKSRASGGGGGKIFLGFVLGVAVVVAVRRRICDGARCRWRPPTSRFPSRRRSSACRSMRGSRARCRCRRSVPTRMSSRVEQMSTIRMCLVSWYPGTMLRMPRTCIRWRRSYGRSTRRATVVGVSDDPPGETYWKVANGIR